MTRRLTPARLAALQQAAASPTGRICARTKASDQLALEELGFAASLCEHGHDLDDPDPRAREEHRGCKHFLGLTVAGRQAADARP